MKLRREELMNAMNDDERRECDCDDGDGDEVCSTRAVSSRNSLLLEDTERIYTYIYLYVTYMIYKRGVRLVRGNRSSLKVFI